MSQSDPICFLAQLAEGRNCIGTDRDGEGRMVVIMSGDDAAMVIGRMDELREGFYVTLVPAQQVKTTRRRKE